MSQQELPELDSRPQGRREWSGALNSLILPLGFVVFIVGLLLYLQTSRGGNAGDSNFGSVQLPAARNATSERPEAKVGRAAPDFILPSLDETTVQLSDFQGRPVVVTFFTTWCESCRVQMPVFADTPQGVALFAVDLQEAPDRVRQFATDFGLTFRLLIDSRGDVAATWKVGGKNEPLPATFFIDATGVVQKVVDGPISASDLSAGVNLIAGGRN